MSFTNHPFVVRVYGICIYQEHLLVCDEYWFDTNMTKFPGGGLEFGEGTIDCLKRESMEELGREVEVLSHFYTTDFFQPTRFIPGKQLISIYYLMKLRDPETLPVGKQAFAFEEQKEGAISPRWIPMKAVSAKAFTLPIDQKVGGMIKKRWPGIRSTFE
ncbi:MAG: NUDIX domain-containing protein [Bacteroidales bacterium]